MDAEQTDRYSRQILLPQIGADGQEKLLASHALIMGMGGLGCPIAMYLAAAGVGRLTLVDFDMVELSNLQRQIAHATADIGRLKTESARDTCLALNPGIRVDLVSAAPDDDELDALVAAADIVIDGCDNFPTRYAINAACVRHRKPLVSGAAMRLEAQVIVYRADLGGGPCYRCLYRDEPEYGETCTQIGVLAPLVGIIGSLQALEAIKVLVDFGEPLNGRLLLLDAASMEWREVKLPRDPACPVCGAG